MDMWMLPPCWSHIFSFPGSFLVETWTTDETWVLVFRWPQGAKIPVTGIMGFVWCVWRRVALLFWLFVLSPTVACFTVLRCAQLILGKFLIVRRYSASKTANDLFDCFFFAYILFAWCFRATYRSLWGVLAHQLMTWLKFARFKNNVSARANSIYVPPRSKLLKFLFTRFRIFW